MPKNVATEKEIRPRLRISFGKDVALGPGKIQLLELIREKGSITAAAAGMSMSYMRAWMLIRTMNQCFREPLVSAVRGGNKGGGGAELTELGQRVLKLYRQMDAKCRAAVQPDWKELRQFLRSRS